MIDKGEVTPWYILLNSGASFCSGQPGLSSLTTCAIIYRLRLYFDHRLRRGPGPGCHYLAQMRTSRMDHRDRRAAEVPL